MAASPTSPRRRPPIGRRQIEAVMAYLVAAGGLVICVQTVPPLLKQAHLLRHEWLVTVVALLFGGVLLSVLFTTLGRFVRTINGLVAIAYLAVVVTWPLGMQPGAEMTGESLWVWYLCVIASAAATIAFPVWLAALYVVVAPAAYGLVRVTPFGGSVDWSLSVLDALYSVIMSGAVLVLFTVLRQAVASVEAVQAVALARYSRAVREQAREQERARVDALVHDDVLGSLLQAARAESADQKRMAAAMAARAIENLGLSVGDESHSPAGVPVSELQRRLQHGARERGLRFEWRDDGVRGDFVVPPAVVDALFSAATQAMVNSVNHAGDRAQRWVAVGARAGAVRLEVGDTGRGFVLGEAEGRLGLRVSILERVRGVGGDVVIDTEPGRGTVVVLRWPDGVGGGDA